jgi:hypothetical protein
VAVAVVDLPRRQRLARLAQFIAAAQQAHAQGAINLDPRNAGRRQQADFLGAQALADTQQALPALHFFTALAHVFAQAQRRAPDTLAVDAATLLGHHAVGAGRQRRTGENPYCLPGL